MTYYPNTFCSAPIGQRQQQNLAYDDQLRDQTSLSNHSPQTQSIDQTTSPEHNHKQLTQHPLAIASITAALATTGALCAFQAKPVYEGRVQLAGILSTTEEATSNSVAVTVSDLNDHIATANIAPPDLVEATHPAFLRNSRMLKTVKAVLASQQIHVSRQGLANRLTAKTTSQGLLELHYHDSEPERVQLVLATVAQWYASQAPSCNVQSCNDATFIQIQRPILQKRQIALQQQLLALRQTIWQQLTLAHTPDSGLSSQDASSSLDDAINQTLGQLEIQQQNVIQYAEQLEQILAQTRDRLEQLQTDMVMTSVKPQSGFALFDQAIPQYSQWIERWKISDRQIMAAQFDLTLDAEKQPHELAQLITQQKVLQSEMRLAVARLTQSGLADMVMPLRELILDDMTRYIYMDPWLDTMHRLQILELRLQTLMELQTTLAHQHKRLQGLQQTELQLELELESTTQALRTYEAKYAIAQRQANKHKLAWQVVTPPEIVRQPRFSDTLFSAVPNE